MSTDPEARRAAHAARLTDVEQHGTSHTPVDSTPAEADQRSVDEIRAERQARRGVRL